MSVACGGAARGCVLAVLRDRNGSSSVWGWGDNDNGELGIGNHTYEYAADPTLANSHHAGASEVQTAVVMVACGPRHSCAVLADGRVFYWGRLLYDPASPRPLQADQCYAYAIPPARAGKPSRAVMAACGASHTLVLTADGQVFSTGDYASGATGFGREHFQNGCLVRVQAGGFQQVIVSMVAAGAHHSVAVDAGGGVWTWGRPRHGALGHGAEPADVSYENTRSYTHALTTPRALGSALPGPVVMVAAAGCHTAAVHADGSLWVWGEGGAGQLGVGDQLDRLVPTQLARAALSDLAVLTAACGPHHSLLATSDGGLWACGRSRGGVLGCGNGGRAPDAPDLPAPTRVAFFDRSADTRVVCIAAGARESVAVTVDGQIYTWGGDAGYLRPTRKPLPADMTAGCFLWLAARHCLAVAMGTQARLMQGEGAELGGDMVRRVLDPRGGVPGPAARLAGIVRLLGGGLAAQP